jgi:hypothetical protein
MEMKKVYVIEYVECDSGGNSLIERSAFNSYRAVSYFLMSLGYQVNPTDYYNHDSQTREYDLNWFTFDSDEVMWIADVHELLVAE